TQIAAQSIQLPQQDCPDFAGGADVGPAARAPVEVFDGHDANLALAVGRFAQSQVFGGVLKVHRHGPVFEDNLVSAAFGLLELLGFEQLRHIDGARFSAQMKADRRRVKHLDQHGRKQVLAGMLLHVIEAAAAINPAEHFTFTDAVAQNVRDPLSLVDHFLHASATQLAGIEGLTARRRIKRRAVEINAFAVRARVHHASPEFGEVAVAVVQPLRHLIARRAESLETLFSWISDIVVLPLWTPDGTVTLI